MEQGSQNISTNNAMPEEPTAAQLYNLLCNMAQAQDNDRAEQAAQNAQLVELRNMFTRLLDTGVPAPGVEHDFAANPINAHNGTATASQALPSTPAHSRDKRKPLPVGEPFNGNKAAFPAWKVHMEYKIRCDAEFIGDAQAQFHFIWSCLSAPVQSVVKAFYAAGGIQGEWDPQGFLAYLDFCYRDAHAMERAQVLLDGIEQGKREPFAAFFVRFNTVLAEAGGSHWDGEQKLHRLRRGLTGPMKDVALNRGVSRTNWEAAIEDYHRIAVDIETASLEAQQRGLASSGAGKVDAQGDTAMVTVAAVQTTQGSRSAPPKRRANWIPEDLFQQRKASGACTRCGQSSHTHRECANAVVINTASTATEGSSGNA